MTLDVIASARRATARRLGCGVLIGVGVLVALMYPAGLYVNAHLDKRGAAVDVQPERVHLTKPHPHRGRANNRSA